MADQQSTFYHCYQCHKRFYGKLSRASSPISSLEASFECGSCKIRFSIGYEVKTFTLAQTEATFSCSQCPRTFKTKYNLRAHFIQHARNRLDKGEKTMEDSPGPVQSLSELPLDRNKPQKPYQCTECGRKFIWERSLRNHISTFTTAKVCRICFKSFEMICGLLKHNLLKHTDNPFLCKVCGKIFRYKSQLILHAPIHSGEQPYECNVCSRKFNHPSSLKKHSLIHAGLKPYQCKVCGHKFNQMVHLRKHALIHSGETPYECRTCGRKFTQESNLRRHRHTHRWDVVNTCTLTNVKNITQQNDPSLPNLKSSQEPACQDTSKS